MRNYFIIAVIIFLCGCASVKLTMPTQADAERANEKFPGHTLAQLNAGKAIFEANCDKCHRLKNPTSRNETEWNDIVPRMVKKVNKKETKIDPEQQQLLLKYLVTMSTAKS